MPKPYCTTDEVKNYCNLISGQNALENSDIEFYIDQADIRVEIDLKAVIDPINLEAITTTPHEVNRLSIYKASELVLIGQGISFIQDQDKSDSKIKSGYAYEYDYLLKKILDGEIRVMDWSDKVNQSLPETTNYYNYPAIIEEIENII